MPIEVDDVLKFVLSFAMPEGVVAQNILYYIVGSIVETDAALLLLEFQPILEDIYETVMENISDDVQSFRLDMAVRDVAGEVWDTVASAPWIGLVGESTAGMTAQGIGAQNTIYGEKPRYRTRKFFPSVSEAYVNGGVLSVEAVANLAVTTSRMQIVQNVAAGQFFPCFWSPTLNRVQTIWQSATRSNDNAAYQRRRKPGVGI